MFGIGHVSGKRLFLTAGESAKGAQAAGAGERDGAWQVGREDRIAAPQMKRLAALQEGILESFELLPEEYRPLSLRTCARSCRVEASVLLARRRSALRRHLEAVDRQSSFSACGASRGAEEIEEGSALRASFEAGARSRVGSCRLRRDTTGDRLDHRALEGIESSSATCVGSFWP